MKAKAILLFSTASLLQAGTPTVAPQPVPASSYWITPTLDIRARYEFADIDRLDPSNAFTTRERVGLKTTDWNGFSALVEGEFSQAIVDKYNGGAPGADPFNPGDSLIADPQTNELNQGYLQYSGYDNVVRAGRQRLIYDNAAFIGNSGWRQNEQTFDAISLSNKCVENLTLNYAYVDQVNRIFGSDADGAPAINPNVQDLRSDTHLLNAAYTGISGVTLGGYVYLMNFDSLSGWNNDTYGLSAKSDALGLTWYGELAFQEDAGPRNSDNAMYAHATATKAFENKHALTLGVEHLGAGFQTPLATLHAFNGFADATDAARASGTHNGLTDLYLTYALPICWGIKWSNSYHLFGDDNASADYGWEIDTVLVKKFDDHFSALIKGAYLEGGNDAFSGGAGGAKLPTTTRISLEVDYAF
jgi:hypothetical protein